MSESFSHQKLVIGSEYVSIFLIPQRLKNLRHKVDGKHSEVVLSKDKLWSIIKHFIPTRSNDVSITCAKWNLCHCCRDFRFIINCCCWRVNQCRHCCRCGFHSFQRHFAVKFVLPKFSKPENVLSWVYELFFMQEKCTMDCDCSQRDSKRSNIHQTTSLTVNEFEWKLILLLVLHSHQRHLVCQPNHRYRWLGSDLWDSGVL